MRKWVTALSCAALFNVSVSLAAYPERPIRFIVSSGAGGAPDFNARILAAELGKQMGQQFVVDNRPGAGSTLGTNLSVAPHVKAGRLRGLAVTTPKRVTAFPELPTVAETVPGFESVSWGGVVVPAGVPRAIIARLNKEVNAALTLPHVREKFAAFGVELSGGSPEVFASQIRKDAAKWADVIRQAGVKPE